MSSVWDSVQYVTSGFTLVAFLGATAAFVVVNQSKKTKREIESVQSDRQAEVVNRTLEFFDIDTANMSSRDKLELAKAQISARMLRFRTIAIAVCFVTALLTGLSAFAIYNSESPIIPALGQDPEVVFDPTSETELTQLGQRSGRLDIVNNKYYLYSGPRGMEPDLALFNIVAEYHHKHACKVNYELSQQCPLGTNRYLGEKLIWQNKDTEQCESKVFEFVCEEPRLDQ